MVASLLGRIRATPSNNNERLEPKPGDLSGKDDKIVVRPKPRLTHSSYHCSPPAVNAGRKLRDFRLRGLAGLLGGHHLLSFAPKDDPFRHGKVDET